MNPGDWRPGWGGAELLLLNNDGTKGAKAQGERKWRVWIKLERSRGHG